MEIFMKKIVWMLLSLVLLTLSLTTSAATVVKANFDAGWPTYDGGAFTFSGSFVGEDLNNDGMLSFGEFSVFNWNSAYNSYTLSDLFDTGDIVISTQTWLANGISWVGADDLAYLTWDDRGQSINTNILGEYRFTSFEVSAVPLPPAVLLFAPALLGFMGLRRKAKLAA
jgi:hypothetical protein